MIDDETFDPEYWHAIRQAAYARACRAHAARTVGQDGDNITSLSWLRKARRAEAGVLEFANRRLRELARRNCDFPTNGS